MAGYPLKISGLACVGALACGPEASDIESGSGGYDLTGTAGPTDTADSTTSLDPTEGPAPDTDMEDPPECTSRGDICGEMSVCQCDCDYDVYCCGCSPAQCTDDSHCDAGHSCVDTSDSYHYVDLECLPAACNTSYLSYPIINSVEMAESFAGDVCLGSLEVILSDLEDLAPFASLEYIHTRLSLAENPALVDTNGLQALRHLGTLEITDNPVLFSIETLGQIESVSGGAIRNNPALATAQIELVLAGIEGGENIEVCGNLDGDPCP